MKRITLSALLMTLFLLMSCGAGSTNAEDPQSRFLKSLISLGNDFLDVFTSFTDMVGGVLGFNTNTKKSDVGAYFKTVQDTVQGTKDKLNKIVADMKSDNNPNAEATDTAVKALITNTLDKIIQGAKTASEAIGTTGDDLLGNVAAHAAPAGAKGETENLIKGIKSIVDVVLKEGSADSGDDKKAEDGSTTRTGGNATDNEAGKLFASANAGAADAAKKSAADAAKAVGAVTGSDILQAIVKDNGDAAKLATAQNAANAAKKDAEVAGAIALRAMAKGGKFTGPSADDQGGVAPIVKGAAVSAVTKALDALTIAIRDTIDTGLKTVKDAININTTDTPVTTDNTTSEAKNQ
ncbi:variable large family protein [Borrelia parkeri]|uniref:variable large family protein n=1 Tax=Borrelia parkeri TaxID=141 RepID=UPI003D7C345E